MVIYKAEFPNGKVYIGKTKNFENRKKSHKFRLKISRLNLINNHCIIT